MGNSGVSEWWWDNPFLPGSPPTMHELLFPMSFNEAKHRESVLKIAQWFSVFSVLRNVNLLSGGVQLERVNWWLIIMIKRNVH